MIKLDLRPDPSKLRQFGFFGLFGFPMIAVVIGKMVTRSSLSEMASTVFAGTAPWWVYAVGALGVVCGLLAAVAPPLLRPIYVLAMLLAVPIGLVLSAVLLRAIYYLLFTPIAWVFRLRGRDAMHRKLEPELASYWQDHRDVTRPRAPASYFRLY
ncbi:MAG: hypothetical protein H6836_01045 [Planctomycetes bacterium]|nr:hypothetical protein [Planctomycetota bacterium]MCB9888129.1 hypothetical protein [Planctomycetota bacterium]